MLRIFTLNIKKNWFTFFYSNRTQNNATTANDGLP